MATEGPLVHDGAQCVAGANLYNPAVPLLGVNGSGQFLAVVLTAARTVGISAALTGTTPMYGVLQNTPMATDPADVGISGITKAVGGATVAFGVELMVNASGQFIAWTTGNYKVGLSLEPFVLNQVFTMMIYGSGIKL